MRHAGFRSEGLRGEEELPGRAYNSKVLLRLASYLKPYWLPAAGALAVMVVSSLLQISSPWITQMAVDRYLAPAAGRHATPLDPWLSSDRWVGLTQLSLAYAAALLFSGLLDALQNLLLQSTGQRAMFDLRQQLFEHLQRLDIAFFDSNPTGRLVTRVTMDIEALNELFTSGLVAIVAETIMLAVWLAAMLMLSPKLTLALVAVLPLMLVAAKIFRRVAVESYRRTRVAIARINAFLAEHLSGMQVLQLFNREAVAALRFYEVNGAHREAFKGSITASAWFAPLNEFLGMLAIGALMALAGLHSGVEGLTIGVLVAFLQYALRFFRPVQELSDRYNVLQSAFAAAEKIFNLLDEKPQLGARAVVRSIETELPEIEFDRVWFAYKPGLWVLEDVSFRVPPGRTFAVVGHTGAGKSTLISLLLRFYDPQRGVIRVGGVDLRDLSPAELRRRFGSVLQDPFLFSGTIAENLRLNAAGISDEQLMSALEQVSLSEFVSSLPDTVNHPVRARGAGLSAGQKQLISIARALAHDPAILLLDEATASVDMETERQIQAALGKLLAGRTAIVIAHRLSTIERAGRILVMNRGRLQEQGTHDELLAARGLYWRLQQLQLRAQTAADPDALPAPGLA